MSIPPQDKRASGETASHPVHGVDTARDHLAGAKASSPLQQGADQSAAVSSSEGSSLVELVVAAIIAPVAEDSLPKLLVPLPAAQRVEVITKSIIHLAKTRATLAVELTITSEDLSLMRMRGAGATLARIISEDRVRLIPSEVLARERALTEVATIIHVGNGRVLGATERLLAILEKFGSRQPHSLHAVRPVLLAASRLPSPRRREPLCRLVERTRQHDEVDRFLRERLRQIVHWSGDTFLLFGGCARPCHG